MNSHILQVFTDKVALVDKVTWWLDSVGLFGILQRARNVRIAQFVETFVMTHCYLEHDHTNPEYQLANYMRNWLLLPGCQMKHLIVNDNYFAGEDGRSAGLKLCTAFVDEALLMPFCKPGGERLEEVVADAGCFSFLPCMKKDEVDENEMRALEGNGEHFSNPEVVADEGCCSFLPCMKKDENEQEETEQDIAKKKTVKLVDYVKQNSEFKRKSLVVNNFINKFNNEYKREPTTDEIYDNLKNNVSNDMIKTIIEEGNDSNV